MWYKNIWWHYIELWLWKNPQTWEWTNIPNPQLPIFWLIFWPEWNWKSTFADGILVANQEEKPVYITLEWSFEQFCFYKACKMRWVSSHDKQKWMKSELHAEVIRLQWELMKKYEWWDKQRIIEYISSLPWKIEEVDWIRCEQKIVVDDSTISHKHIKMIVSKVVNEWSKIVVIDNLWCITVEWENDLKRDEIVMKEYESLVTNEAKQWNKIWIFIITHASKKSKNSSNMEARWSDRINHLTWSRYLIYRDWPSTIIQLSKDRWEWDNYSDRFTFNRWAFIYEWADISDE